MMTAMPRPRPAAFRLIARRTLLAGLALAAAALPAVGCAAEAGAYEVEIVVFRHLDQRGTTPEMAAPAALAPATAPNTAPTPEPAAGVAHLDEAALRLAGIAARLRRGPGYQLVYHGGWSQGAGPRAQAAATPLPAEALQAGLSGGITLYRERYLHALVDVSLAAGGDATGSSWRIRQGRRLRGTALQYFDHPGFGVILAVRAPAGASDAGPASAADEEP